MLGKLVNKFKKHSLQEDGIGSVPTPNNANSGSILPTGGTLVLPRQQPYRRSARISALYGGGNVPMIDSGTESDDDELEQLDSNLNRADSSDIMGSSPPNLTSSPPLASEFETNSKSLFCLKSSINDRVPKCACHCCENTSDYCVMLLDVGLSQVLTFSTQLSVIQKVLCNALNDNTEGIVENGLI